MFTAVIVRIARQWDQPWCLYIDEVLIKMRYIYIMEFYKAANENVNSHINRTRKKFSQ